MNEKEKEKKRDREKEREREREREKERGERLSDKEREREREREREIKVREVGGKQYSCGKDKLTYMKTFTQLGFTKFNNNLQFYMFIVHDDRDKVNGREFSQIYRHI